MKSLVCLTVFLLTCFIISSAHASEIVFSTDSPTGSKYYDKAGNEVKDTQEIENFNAKTSSGGQGYNLVGSVDLTSPQEKERMQQEAAAKEREAEREADAKQKEKEMKASRQMKNRMGAMESKQSEMESKQREIEIKQWDLEMEQYKPF